MRRVLISTLAVLALAAPTLVRPAYADTHSQAQPPRQKAGQPPYPASRLLSGIAWDKSTYGNAGAGGDIWSNTTGPGGVVYAAWGDGAIGCPGKVSYGLAKLTGGPSTHLQLVSCGPPGFGKGKLSSLLAIGTTLYAVANVQDKPWPDNSIGIWRSADGGKTWQRSSWTFNGTDLRPNSFANFGAGYAGSRDSYVYLTAIAPTSSAKSFYLLRAPKDQLANKAAYQYFSGTPTSPAWSASRSGAVPVFTDANGVSGASIVYDAAIHRYVLTLGHGSDAGNLGIFEAPEPWGPWSTVAYEDRWLGINSGEYLGVRMPSAWISGGGLTVWAVFGCYGCGQPFDDHYNLIRGTFQTVARKASAVAP